MVSQRFVPADFEVPMSIATERFHLEPLSPGHNDRDYEAWMSSIDHIRSTPGFEDSDWPAPMDLNENLADLVGHADDFSNRVGFTYSIIDGDEVIGCLYIYPSGTPTYDASAKSWVRETRAEMDVIVWESVSQWLVEKWPFRNPQYAVRTDAHPSSANATG
jgi:hypothetical protein